MSEDGSSMRAKTDLRTPEPGQRVLQKIEKELQEREWRQYFSEQEWHELEQLTLCSEPELELQAAYWSRLLMSWDTRSLKPFRPVYEEVRAILDIYLDYLGESLAWERSQMDFLLLRLADTQVNLQHKQLLFWRFEYEQKQQRTEALGTENERAQAEFYNLSELTQFVGENLKNKEKLIRDALDGLMGVLDASWAALYIYDDASGQQGNFYTLHHEEFQIYNDYVFPHTSFWNPFWRASINQSYQHEVNEAVPELEAIFPGTRTLMTQTLKLPNDGRGLLMVCSSDAMAFSGFRQLFNIFGTHIASALQNTHLHAQLNELAIRDALTGVFNRRHLEERMAHSYELSRRYSRELSLLMVDLDHFKNINDTYGHPLGDQVLKAVCSMLCKRLRSTDIIGRYGGEEFMVILQETGASGAQILSEDLVHMVSAAEIELEEISVPISISVGYASFPEHAIELDELIKQADDGLYLAKKQGRNRVGFVRSSEGGEPSSVLQ